MIVSAAAGSRTVVRVEGRRHAKWRGKINDTMLIWVNHIDRSTEITSVVANNGGKLTAHAVLATYKSRWSTERGSDTFPAEVLLVIFIGGHCAVLGGCLDSCNNQSSTARATQLRCASRIFQD